MMNTPSMSTGIKSRLTTNNPLDLMRQKLMKGWQKIGIRFREASSEFNNVLEGEELIHKRSQLLEVEDQASVAQAILAGYLVGKTTYFQLYEGLNYFTVGDDGLLKGQGLSSSQAVAADYQIRVMGNEMVVESSEAGTPAETLETNDSISLGREGYLLKLLPEEYRLKSIVTLKHEG